MMQPILALPLTFPGSKCLERTSEGIRCTQIANRWDSKLVNYPIVVKVSQAALLKISSDASKYYDNFTIQITAMRDDGRLAPVVDITTVFFDRILKGKGKTDQAQKYFVRFKKYDPKIDGWKNGFTDERSFGQPHQIDPVSKIAVPLFPLNEKDTVRHFSANLLVGNVQTVEKCAFLYKFFKQGASPECLTLDLDAENDEWKLSLSQIAPGPLQSERTSILTEYSEEYEKALWDSEDQSSKDDEFFEAVNESLREEGYEMVRNGWGPVKINQLPKPAESKADQFEEPQLTRDNPNDWDAVKPVSKKASPAIPVLYSSMLPKPPAPSSKPAPLSVSTLPNIVPMDIVKKDSDIQQQPPPPNSNPPPPLLPAPAAALKSGGSPIPQVVNESDSEEDEEAEDYACPLTYKVMLRPMRAPSGHSFEETAILEWLGKHSTNPITQGPLTADQLVHNFELQKIIDNYNIRKAKRKAKRAAAKKEIQKT